MAAKSKVSISFSCPKCHSDDIRNTDGPDEAIVTCGECGKEFGTAKAIREKAMAEAKKQVVADAKQIISDGIKTINKRR